MSDSSQCKSSGQRIIRSFWKSAEVLSAVYRNMEELIADTQDKAGIQKTSYNTFGKYVKIIKIAAVSIIWRRQVIFKGNITVCALRDAKGMTKYMKIDRILGIIIYLLNHDHIPASYFSKRYQVSVRTIQRDITCISAIGIPIYADAGKAGGYSILPDYKIKNSDIREDEQKLILKALESLASTYSCDTLDTLIDKYNVLVEKENGKKVFWDFSVTKENRQVQDSNRVLEQAINQKKYLTFAYRNANGDISNPIVQPLAIHYKWYAWYLFAYVDEKKEYRTYKVARMDHLEVSSSKYDTNHGSIEERMKESEKTYYSTCIHIEVHFAETEKGLMNEYFPDSTIEQLENKVCRLFVNVPAGERLWKALLLSFGDKVKVVAPNEYQKELIDTAEKFLSNYDI